MLLNIKKSRLDALAKWNLALENESLVFNWCKNCILYNMMFYLKSLIKKKLFILFI
jgi:hypothetical protein